MTRPAKAMLAILAADHGTAARARSWWSLEIPALEGIRDADPLYGPSSALLMEDTSFLYGSYESAKDHVKYSPLTSDYSARGDDEEENEGDEEEDAFVTNSTPQPSMHPTPFVMEQGQERQDEQAGSPLSASPVTATPTDAPTWMPTADPSPGAIGNSTDTPMEPPVQLVGPFPAPPTASPAASPTASPATAALTDRPTDRPTPEPSQRHESANGGCPLGQGLHRLWLYDLAGDGWGSTRLVIKKRGALGAVFEGSLDAERGVATFESEANIASIHGKDRGNVQLRRLGTSLAGSFSRPSSTAAEKKDGNANQFGGPPDGNVELVSPRPSHGNGEGASEVGPGGDEVVYLCLSQGICYEARVSGGTFLEEVRWEITRVDLGDGDNVGLVAAGVGTGSGSCEFSLDNGCAETCDGTAQIPPPTSSPTVAFPSQDPTDAPIAAPTQPPSTYRSRKPASASPTGFLPQDKGFAFGLDEYKQIKEALLSASPSSAAALEDDASPQSRALNWIYGSGASGLSDRRLVQRWALASFYHGAGGDGWIVKTGWMGRGDECGWHGVSCLAGIVGKLELKQNRLRGELVPEIATWKHYLYVLSLGNDNDAPEGARNEFIAPVPSFLGDLNFLSFLNLEGVGMTSTIPEGLFSSWSHLESLFLNGNDITGSLPKSVGSLSSIEVLWLGGNNLSGSIVSEIGQLSTLRDLSLESNYREDVAGKRGFIATVPSEIGQLTNLEMLTLADNALSGLLPKLDDLISLRHLQLSGNFFEGQLPPAWGRLEMLEELDISFNWLSSTIPAEYGNMISLTNLSLRSNYNDNEGYFTWGFKGKLPPELGKLKNLQHINLSNNYLTGTLITEFGQLYQLQTMDLQNNFLQGPIPTEYSNSVSMRELILQDNNIDGESFGVPEEICRLPDLELARVDCDVSCSCCLTTC